MKTFIAACLAGSTMAMVGVASAATKTFSATLDGQNESPVVDSGATGTAVFTIDDVAKTICGTITYSRLSGDPTAIHVHQGKATDADGGVLFGVASNASPVKVSFSNVGAAKLAPLSNGSAYVDVHTAEHPDGELRGELVVGGDVQTCETIAVDAGADAGRADAAEGDDASSVRDAPAPPPTETSPSAPASKHDDGGCTESSASPAFGGATAVLGVAAALTAVRRRRRKHHRAR